MQYFLYICHSEDRSSCSLGEGEDHDVLRYMFDNNLEREADDSTYNLGQVGHAFQSCPQSFYKLRKLVQVSYVFIHVHVFESSDIMGS